MKREMRERIGELGVYEERRDILIVLTEVSIIR